MTITRVCRCLAAIGLLAIVADPATADPAPGELLKFYQMPLNNGATPYLPGVATYPALLPPALPYGADPSRAFYPGHDELSTAYASGFAPPNPNDPIGQPIPIAWQGTYMADDFADYAGTPISHVRWWGSYMGQNSTGLSVKKFLISFEHNVPAAPGPNGTTIPSHPDFNHPGNLHQIVDLVAPALLFPPPGKFTEKFVPTPIGPGLIPPPEPLFEYNAELNLDKWFHEEAASQSNFDDVYWLKIVALVDPQHDGPINWGWHDRDWSIMDPLAAKPGDTPDGAEHIEGFVGPPGGVQPVWHFEDDAVSGAINVTPGMSPIMPNVQQTGFIPQNYVLPWDGPNGIQQFSKDLAFELYTRVPEPASVVLVALAVLGTAGMKRRRS